MVTLRQELLFPHFTDEETKAWRGEFTQGDC